MATSTLVGISTFAAAVSVNQTVIPVLIAVLSSGFVFGLFKIMPERRSILVQASENAVKVVNDAIGTLQKELGQARLEIARLENELAHSKVEREKFEKDIVVLRERIIKLESQLEIYQRIRGEARYADDAARKDEARKLLAKADELERNQDIRFRALEDEDKDDG
ncbi:hypothetical protein [Ferruginibacter sp.]|uniref:hypothetical protein n=1 Tax=Ferruginibacter sp. TaxID=1940288 RepID=UPI00265B4F62|nr:hypothetical protein [Ferruginibacter sp.]